MKRFILFGSIMTAMLFLTSCGTRNAVEDYSYQNIIQGSEEMGDILSESFSETESLEAETSESFSEAESLEAETSESFSETEQTNAGSSKTSWSFITEDGVDEELLIADLDEEVIVYVADELQSLVEEEVKEERENPEILLSEGWTRVFEKEQYTHVLELGESAMLPLYFILYKSENSGMYEYICACALYELSGYDFTNDDGSLQWSTSKEFQRLFEQVVLGDRKSQVE